MYRPSDRPPMMLNISNHSPIEVNGENLPTTEEFTYLGSKVRHDGAAGTDIQSRLSKARNSFRMLNNLIARCNQLYMDTIIMQRRLRWQGYVMRKELGNITRTALHWTPEGRSKRGWPLNTLRRTVESELKITKHTWSSMQLLAQTREEWRSFFFSLHVMRHNVQEATDVNTRLIKFADDTTLQGLLSTSEDGYKAEVFTRASLTAMLLITYTNCNVMGSALTGPALRCSPEPSLTAILLITYTNCNVMGSALSGFGLAPPNEGGAVVQG
ncbi:hypothetical protein EGW08_003227 [Elysia chlorotica]|uniref:Uncharacterized protein n=1 Tax=Elysia chlorotica TaxID=188477 RepID=A0A3S1HZ07_ELYCH|nr:hypothetical protein EGW08_003227 [Elysia chlorotica]